MEFLAAILMTALVVIVIGVIIIGGYEIYKRIKEGL